MIYSLLRFIFRIANRFYFRTIQVKGSENIPEKGPVFFVANHPSAFMDPIVIGTVVKRPLFFLAKGALFQNAFTRWLFPKFNMIPIFRNDETPGQGHKNKDVFLHCHKHLAKSGAILIFPEGVSLTERKIKKIQTGTARICLGAEAENNFNLDIRIVPIGLNFSDPHKFQSDLFVNIDTPIHVSDYYEAFKEDAFKAAHALTDEIRRRLETQVVAIQDAEVDKLVANIEQIYKSQLLVDLGHSPKNMKEDFDATRAISDSVHYFMEEEPLRVEKMKTEIDLYLKDLERLSLNDDLIRKLGKRSPFFDALRSFLYLALGLPFFIFGFINNYLPFKLPGWGAKLISKREEFFGSISLSLGTFTFLLFYSIQIWLLNKWTGDWRIVLAYAILLPVSGLFAFYYFRRFTTVRGNWKIFSLFYKKTNLVTSLISKRRQIIEGLEKGKEDFIRHREGRIDSGSINERDASEDVNEFFNLNG